MSEFIENVQDQIRRSSKSFLTFSLRLGIGLVLGVSFSLMGQVFWGYKSLVFWFVTSVIAGIFLRMSQKWSVLGVGIFFLIFILVSLLLRLYIVVAPG